MTDYTADVVVVGGGAVGTSTAFHLASLGAGRVVLCERRSLAAGASGRSGALVRMHYTNEPEARLAFLSLRYFRNWDDLVGAGDCGFVPSGFVRLVSPENLGKLRANVEMLRRVGINTRIIGREELAELAPEWDLSDVEIAAYEPDSGYANPVATTEGFAERARQLGADIRTGTEVTGIRVDGGRVAGVATSAGFISTRTVVIAGGAWAVPLLRSLGVGVDLRPARIQVAIFDRPPVLGTGRPLITCIDGANGMYFRSEGPDWSRILAGLSSYRLPLEDPDQLKSEADPDYLAAVRERLSRRLPVMGFVPPRGGWAGAIVLSPDGKPVIDRHPEVEGLYFFTADNGTSFKTSPAVGLTLAEWVVFGAPRSVDVRPFRASRFAEGKPLIGEHEYEDLLGDALR